MHFGKLVSDSENLVVVGILGNFFFQCLIKLPSDFFKSIFFLFSVNVFIFEFCSKVTLLFYREISKNAQTVSTHEEGQKISRRWLNVADIFREHLGNNVWVLC